MEIRNDNKHNDLTQEVRPPLFIGGFPSGGTDLLKTVLNAHPEIYLNGEMPFLHLLTEHGYSADTVFNTPEEISALTSRLEKYDVFHTLENLSHDFTSDLNSDAQLTFSTVLRNVSNKDHARVWGNKTPQNTEHMGMLLDLFPEAYFIIIARDVRDTCLSWRKKWGKSLYLCAQKWRNRMKAVWDRAGAMANPRIIFIRFEDLLENTEEVTKKLTTFLGLDWSANMLEHHMYTQRIFEGKFNYGQPIKATNTGKWKTALPARQVRRIEAIAYDTMQVFGYQVEYAEHYAPIGRIRRFMGKLRDLYAIIFRVKSQFSHLCC